MEELQTGHPVLKTPSIIPLNLPGSESNYIDWAMILCIHFRVSVVSYILTDDSTKTNPETLSQDNLAVCSVISRAILPANFQYIQKHEENALGMWKALKEAHQDNSLGGRMYWLRKLLLTKLNNKDMPTHLSKIVSYGEKLGSLITPENPLTTDDLQSTAILLSLPDDWVGCVSSMMNEESVPSSKIITALKQEHLRRQTRIEDEIVHSVNTKNLAKAHSKGKSTQNPNVYTRTYYCTHCKTEGHSFSRCPEVLLIMEQSKRNNQP